MVSEYTNPVQNNLEGYIPLPLDTLFKAGQAIQNRGDAAQQQNDQVQTGLSSMEALAPAHRDFVNKFANDFKTQQGALLDKYQGNTSDPQYINESRRLNMQFAADPKLQIIKQANDLYRKKENIKDELDSKGIKYLDTNPSFSGVDSQGNLTSNPGNLKATNFDANIDQGFRDKSQIMTTHGNLVTNGPALHNEKMVRLAGLANGTDKDMNDAVNYYKQQGSSDDQAKKQALSLLDKGMGFLKEAPNYEGMNYNRAVASDAEHIREFNIQEGDKQRALAEKAREADLKKQGKGPNGFGEITSTGTPLIPSTVNNSKIAGLDSVLGNLNSAGGIKTGNFNVADTPENRKKYPDAYSNITSDGSSSFLTVDSKKYNPDEAKLVDEARDMLGSKAKNSQGQWLSDKSVLSQYKQTLANTRSESLSYASPANDKYTKALTALQFGSNGERLGSDFMVITKDGTFKSGTPEAEKIIGGIKHYSANGINASPVGDYPNGSIRATAMQTIKDGSGNESSRPVTIIKPMDSGTQSQYRFANLGARAKDSQFSNDELRTSKQAQEFRVPAKGGGYYVPQKGITADNRIGIHFIHIDEKGKDLGDKPIPLDDVVKDAHGDFFSRLGGSIDDKPEKQSYSDDTNE